MKTIKKVSAMLLAGAMCVSLAACGGSDAGSATASTADSTAANSTGGKYKVDTLKVSIWDQNQQEGLQKIADEWTEQSGVKVDIEVVTWDSYWTLLEAGASGGELPDVFWMHSNTAQMYMENDILLNLTDYVAADDSTDTSKYYPGIMELFTRSDGNIYALPKDHDTNALLYNKAIFDQYGVAYPDDSWTWEDMYEAAKTITEKSNGEVYGYACNTSNDQDSWYNVVYSYGAQIITDDHKGTTIGSAEGKAGMEMVRKLLTVSAPQAVVSETGTDSLFQSGKVAMLTQGSYMILSYYQAENHDDYAWAMLPYNDRNGDGECQQDERWTCYNGLGWAADANTEDPQAAYDLIAWFCSEQGQKKQAELGVTMAGMPGVSEAFASAFPGLDTSAFTRIEDEGTMFFRPYTRNSTLWTNALQQSGGFLEAWQNPNDPALMETACDNAQTIIEQAIANE